MRKRWQMQPHEIKTLNAEYAALDAPARLEKALNDARFGRIALVSSFGADAVVLLHLVAQQRRDLPVLFLDTQVLFPETLAYQQQVAEHLGLTDLRIQRPDPAELIAEDPDGDLNKRNPDACCRLRKGRPLAKALEGFESWITGRKRFQTGARAELPVVEWDGQRLKLNPLADWTAQDIAAYIAAHDLPRHPLIDRGYRSIGCVPCTSPTKAGEDPRAGRWRGSEKEECGIHFVDGRIVRGPVTQPATTEEEAA